MAVDVEKIPAERKVLLATLSSCSLFYIKVQNFIHFKDFAERSSQVILKMETWSSACFYFQVFQSRSSESTNLSFSAVAGNFSLLDILLPFFFLLYSF